ncbi:hypothetical protein HYC85_005198 [Camellia sinensis]|uniref:B box-type domain-containing protein n=1 Tax=Camellia sinensis TaxID=4442 RepID=A0A7J7HYS5_CAMSI|nr:hypothetical protein HYC85_005198 [Camellia sinensis]
MNSDGSNESNESNNSMSHNEQKRRTDGMNQYVESRRTNDRWLDLARQQGGVHTWLVSKVDRLDQDQQMALRALFAWWLKQFELSKDERAIQQRALPEWLESLLQRTFFGSCAIHEAPKNELKRYCIDCNSSACQHCIEAGSHAEHKVLKLYRHVYKDVVPLNAMEEHIDCSEIQVLFLQVKSSEGEHV